jgi:membrane-associated phospholipid phosphatase
MRQTHTSLTATLEDRLAQSHGFTRADLSLAAAATKAGRRPALKPVAQLAEIADRPPLLLIAAAVTGAGFLRRDRKMKRAGLRMLVAIGLATSAAKTGKKLVSRTRPRTLVDEHRHAMFRGGPNRSEFNSFPSAHAAGGFAAARAASRDYPAFAPEALSTAVVAGGLKVLKGDHFPSDTLAGLAIGAAAELIANRLIPPESG